MFVCVCGCADARVPGYQFCPDMLFGCWWLVVAGALRAEASAAGRRAAPKYKMRTLGDATHLANSSGSGSSSIAVEWLDVEHSAHTKSTACTALLWDCDTGTALMSWVSV